MVSDDRFRFKQSRVNYFSQMPWLVLMVQIQAVKGQLFQSDAMVSGDRFKLYHSNAMVSVDGSRLKQSRVNYFSPMPWSVC